MDILIECLNYDYTSIGSCYTIIKGCCIWGDYKKTVIIWLPVQLLFNAQIAVRYSSPAMSLVMTVDFFLLFYYFIKKSSLKQKINKEPFVLTVPMILVILTFIFSSLLGIIQAFSGITTMIKYFVSGFGMVFLAQKLFYTQQDLKLFINSCIYVGIMITLLGLSESILKDNLWLDFVYFNSPHDETTAGRMFYTPPSLGGNLEIRYGMVRARSFFGIHITYGFACLMYLWLLLLTVRRKWQVSSSNLLRTITQTLLLAGIFMANAKTGYIGLIILILSLYPLSQIFNIKIIFPTVVAIVMLFIYFPEYLNNFYSLFDSKIADEGGGSTIEGRETQFKVALKMFEMNPLFGNGPGSIEVLKGIGNNHGILGAESSWMQILPERGLFGIFAYLFLYIYALFKMKSYIPFKILFLFLTSIFVMETATGVLDMSIWGVVLMAALRMFQLNKKGLCN